MLVDMDEQIDLGQAAESLLDVAAGIGEDALDSPTPCAGRSVSQLLWHLLGLTTAFRAAAEKDLGPATDTDPDTAGWAEVEPEWHARLTGQTHALVAAWREPDAVAGMTRVGGQDLPGAVAGMVALDELVLHGWDLASATGQEYRLDEATAAAVLAFVEGFDPGGTPGLFGPAVTAPEEANTLERLVARSGRDPRWRP